MRIPMFKTMACALAAVALTAATPAFAHDHWHGGGWWGPAAAFGIAGFAAGTLLAQPAYPAYYPAYPAYYAPPPPPPDYDDCWRRRPIYDRWGRYLGRRTVDVCN